MFDLSMIFLPLLILIIFLLSYIVLIYTITKNINMHITGGRKNGRIMYFTCPEDLEHYGIKFATELYNSPTSQHLIDCCSALINDRCKRAGVPLYVFHYVEHV